MVFCLFSLPLFRKMSSIVEDFFTFPSEILLERCTKEELLQIAERFSVEITRNKKLKETLMHTVRSALVERGFWR